MLESPLQVWKEFENAYMIVMVLLQKVEVVLKKKLSSVFKITFCLI